MNPSASLGMEAGVASVERMQPNYRTVCHLLWEMKKRGRGRGEDQGGWKPLLQKEKQIGIDSRMKRQVSFVHNQLHPKIFPEIETSLIQPDEN